MAETQDIVLIELKQEIIIVIKEGLPDELLQFLLAVALTNGQTHQFQLELAFCKKSIRQFPKIVIGAHEREKLLIDLREFLQAFHVLNADIAKQEKKQLARKRRKNNQ